MDYVNLKNLIFFTFLASNVFISYRNSLAFFYICFLIENILVLADMLLFLRYLIICFDGIGTVSTINLSVVLNSMNNFRW